MKTMTHREQQLQLLERLQIEANQGKVSSSLVSPATDYLSDPRVCLTIIAYPPKDLVERFVAWQNRLREVDQAPYYLPSYALHVSCANIRVVNDPPRFTEDDLVVAKQVIEEVAKRHQPVMVQYEKLLRLPTNLLAVGTTDALWSELVKDLRASFKEAGVPDDKSYISEEVFFVNTTLVRYTQTPSEAFFRCVDEIESEVSGEFLIEKLHLVSCNAVLAPWSMKEHIVVKLG